MASFKQVNLLLGLLVIQLVWYTLKQLFTSVSVKVLDIFLHLGEKLSSTKIAIKFNSAPGTQLRQGKKQSRVKTDKPTTEFKLIAIQYIAYNPLYIWLFIPMTLAHSHTVWFQKNSFCSVDDAPGEVLPYIRYTGMCRPKGYGF